MRKIPYLFTFLILILITEAAKAQDDVLVDFSSSSKGILVPRLTTDQRELLSNASQGLLLYDTDTESFWFYDEVWIELVSGQNGLRDKDRDTRVEVEQSPDEDQIRFTVNGEEKMSLTDQNLNLLHPDTSTLIGQDAGIANNSGSVPAVFNTFIGFKSGFTNYNDNIFFPYGGFIGDSIRTGNEGSDNTFIGNHSGFHNQRARHNTFIGSWSGYNTDKFGYDNYPEYLAFGPIGQLGSDNTFIGHASGFYNDGGKFNTYIGSRAGYTNGKTEPGNGEESSYNTIVGAHAADGIDGFNNTIVGALAARYEELNGAGSNNTIIGAQIGLGDGSIGQKNVIIGSQAGCLVGDKNVIIGYQAAGYGENFEGCFGSVGTGNVIIGHNLGGSAGDIDLGSEQLIIDNDLTTSPLLHGNFATDEIEINGSLKLPDFKVDSNLFANKNEILMEASDSIVFQVGQNKIVLNQNGITIEAVNLTIKTAVLLDIDALQMDTDASATMSLDAPIIILNSGMRQAARAGDPVVANPAGVITAGNPRILMN